MFVEVAEIVLTEKQRCFLSFLSTLTVHLRTHITFIVTQNVGYYIPIMEAPEKSCFFAVQENVLHLNHLKSLHLVPPCVFIFCSIVNLSQLIECPYALIYRVNFVRYELTVPVKCLPSATECVPNQKCINSFTKKRCILCSTSLAHLMFR